MSADSNLVRRYLVDDPAALAAFARLEAAEADWKQVAQHETKYKLKLLAQRDALADALRQIAVLWKGPNGRNELDRADSIARAALAEAGLEPEPREGWFGAPR